MPKEVNKRKPRSTKGLNKMIFKTERAANGFELCHPRIREIALDLDGFLNDNHDELLITETFTTLKQDKALNRKSSTHREGRAIDIATSHLDMFIIKELIYYANMKYGKYGAIKDGKPRLIVYGDERHLDHIHLQLNRLFSVVNKERFYE